MSRGTKITPLRLTPDMLARIHAAIDRNNARRADEPYRLTSWIRQAIEERLAKLERGRKGRKRQEPAADAGGAVGSIDQELTAEGGEG